jgi:hypothetical protein
MANLNSFFYQQLSSFSFSNILLPIPFTKEKTSSFLNLEGKFLRSCFIEVPFGNLRLDWSIYFL